MVFAWFGGDKSFQTRERAGALPRPTLDFIPNLEGEFPLILIKVLQKAISQRKERFIFVHRPTQGEGMMGASHSPLNALNLVSILAPLVRKSPPDFFYLPEIVYG
jgi:hypothetical protein